MPCHQAYVYKNPETIENHLLQQKFWDSTPIKTEEYAMLNTIKLTMHNKMLFKINFSPQAILITTQI
jgi:hypothetical protein